MKASIPAQMTGRPAAAVTSITAAREEAWTATAARVVRRVITGSPGCC